MWSRAQLAVAVTCLAGGAIGIYGGSFANEFVWDDDYQIAGNPAVAQGAPLGAYFLDRATTSNNPEYNARIYRPLRNLTWRGIAMAAGTGPFAFHAANVILHAASAILVFALLLTVFGDPLAALAGAGVWTVLPVHVEAVSFATSLADLLSLNFQLGALLCGLRAIRGTQRPGANAALSVFLAAAAMLAKEMAVMTVALLGLMALLEGQRSRRVIGLLAAHAATAVAYVILRTVVIGRVGQETSSAATLLDGLREAPVLLVAYARVTVTPLGHNPAYFIIHPTLGPFLLVVAAILATFGLAWAADRKWPHPPGLRLGLAWFAVSLFPVLHILPVWAHVADRFALAPSVGVALLLGAAVTLLPAARKRRIVVIAAVPLLILYGAATAIEQRPWRNDLSLWLHATDESPGSGMAWLNLARASMKRGLFAPALAAIDKALGPDPDVPKDLWLWRATALDGLGRTEEALRAADQAVVMLPASAQALALQGDLRLRRGDLPGAATALAAAKQRNAVHPSVRLLDAAVHAAQGQPADALAIYAALAAESPSEVRFRFLLAEALLAAGETARAIKEAEACLRIDADWRPCADLKARAAGPAH